jgi:hypothetical protein
VNELTSKLKGPNKGLIRQIVSVIGEERARAILDPVLASEAQDGPMTLDGTRRKPAGGLVIRVQEAINDGQRAPQEQQLLPQVGEGLGFRGIRSETEGELLTRLGRCRMQDEVSEQRLLAGLVESRERCSAIEQLELAQKVNVERWHRPLLHPSA